MSTAIMLVEIAILFGLVILYLRWRRRFSSAEQVVDEIKGFAGWAQNHKEEWLRYTRIAEVVVGMFLLGFGYFIGKDHLHLIRGGVRAEGTIIGYKQQYFRGSDGRLSNGTEAFMPIVKFRTEDREVEFKDWMGTNAAVLNVRVKVLYDPEKPGMAMIDRPVWNWIPWAPTLGMGLFLILVGVRGWVAGN
ncbi:MAG TPA: DUF3592 domain-containing protein [Candidatus Limnocylindrales bacterium]|nr:DUF3592 domain-containing protein [Candidatus Limnocylindrales bacterium]